MSKLLIILAWAFSINIYCAQKNEIIPNASYFIYGGATGVRGDEFISDEYNCVNFYTFDGILICQKEMNRSYSTDSQACMPQPVRYKIVYWPEIHPDANPKDSVSGEFVVFYDKSNNIIKSYRYEGPKPVTIKSVAAQKTLKIRNKRQLCIGEFLDLRVIAHKENKIHMAELEEQKRKRTIYEQENLRVKEENTKQLKEIEKDIRLSFFK